MPIRRNGPNVMLKGRSQASPVAQRQSQRFRRTPQVADLICDCLIARNYFDSQRLNRLADSIRWRGNDPPLHKCKNAPRVANTSRRVLNELPGYTASDAG